MKSIARKILQKPKCVIKQLGFFAITVIQHNSFLSGIYYAFFSSAFHRENRAVLSGKIRYYHDIKKKGTISVFLRRNIHRLEKGLIMRPRKAIFAESYIMETVNAYQAAISGLSDEQIASDTNLKWAHDVLEAYFMIIDPNNKIIETAYNKFNSLPGVFTNSEKLIPYYRNLGKSCSVDYNNLLELAKFRRSVRYYEQKPVPREIVDNALKVAAYSPSACNRQPFEFRVFDDPEMIKLVAKIPGGARGFAQNFPGIVVVIGGLNAYFDERDRHIIYIDASLAAMSFIYALETQGVSSCIINWPDLKEREKQMQKTLNLEVYQRVIMLISFGYPDPQGMVPFSQKKSIQNLRNFNL